MFRQTSSRLWSSRCRSRHGSKRPLAGPEAWTFRSRVNSSAEISGISHEDPAVFEISRVFKHCSTNGGVASHTHQTKLVLLSCVQLAL